MKKVLLLSTILIGLNVFSQVNLNSGLVAYYPYSGNTNDVVGNANGNVSGTVILTNDRFGNSNSAYQFNNGTINSTILAPFTATYSVVLWFKTSHDLTQKIVQWRGSNGASGPMNIQQDVTIRISNTNTNLRRYIFHGPNGNCTDIDQVNSISQYSDNNWHMLTIKKDGLQSIELFIDNVSLGTTPLEELCDFLSSGIGHQTFAVGGQSFEEAFSDIDDIMIYDRILSAAEITELYELTEPFTLNTLTVNSNSISTFSQTLGTPSSEQSFTVSGTNLTNNITVTAPTNYEISLSSGSGFASSVQVNQTSGTVPTTTIYVRLNAAAVGAYSGDITLTSGALNETVAVTGNTTENTSNLNENTLTLLSIFPNPGSGMITLSVNQPTTAVFMSTNGAILANLELNGETSIDVSTYAPGVYFIRTAEGQTVKFIKE
jgi:hypothetical protein